MKKRSLKSLALNKTSVSNLTGGDNPVDETYTHTCAECAELSGWCDPSEDGASIHNPMNSNIRSLCIGCEESFGILC